MQVWRGFASIVVLSCAMLSVPLALQAQELTYGEPPASLFNGRSLSGWEPIGAGKWEVRDGAIVGSAVQNGDGWLVLKDGYQDFVLEFDLQCGVDCRTGVLLRAWKEGNGLNGIYIPIGGADMGKMYRAAVGADHSITKKSQMPWTSPVASNQGIDEGPCDPYPCAGIRDAKGGALSLGTGSSATPKYTLDPGWNKVTVTMRGDVISASINGNPVASAQMDAAPLYGVLAVQAGNVKLKDVLSGT
jgi:hypothetical protein